MEDLKRRGNCDSTKKEQLDSLVSPEIFLRMNVSMRSGADKVNIAIKRSAIYTTTLQWRGDKVWCVCVLNRKCSRTLPLVRIRG